MNDAKHNVTQPDTLANARRLRSATTPMEARLWFSLRNRGCGGFKFRRQAAIGAFIADFVCHEAKLIVELDGASHEGTLAYDSARTLWLEHIGYSVLRFSNEEVQDNLEGVVLAIRDACNGE